MGLLEIPEHLLLGPASHRVWKLSPPYALVEVMNDFWSQVGQ